MNITKIPKSRREREVWEACDELWEELQEEGLSISELTGERLKSKLVDLGYKRGNQGQIYQYRNSWQLSRGIGESEDLILEERNAFLSEKVQKAVDLLFKEIQAEADAKIIRSKDELEVKLKEYGNKCDVIKKENEVFRNKLDEAIQELNVVKQTNTELASQLSKEKHEHEITKERLNNIEVNYNQLKVNSEKSERLLNERNEKDKKEAQNKMDGLVDAHKKDMSALKEQSENKRHQYIAEIENLKVANNKLDRQLEKVTLLEQKTSNINNELKHRVKSLENELGQAHKTHNDLIQKSHDAEKIFAETKGELKQLQILLNNQKEDYQNANKQLLDYKERVGRLEEQLQQAKMELTKKMPTKQDK